jgi:WD40 repeat protein/energy-coupling factor transporter ATP-binding protein EcfA2
MSRDALVVGISAYQWLPSLNAPAQDAEAIAQGLQADGDFRVARMPDIVQAGQSRVGTKTPVTLAELEAALVRLFKPRGANVPQTALFYFSGHGLQKDAGIQEGYLATSDVNPQAGFYGLSLFWLRRLLQESPVRQRIILLDCCHSGELLNFLEADPGARSGTDRLFMAASREYEAAYESLTGQHSVFTQALLEGLEPGRIPTGTVTNYALTDWVSTALKAEMQQPLFENSGSEIILTRCQGAPTVIKTELSQEICPYRGLECFDEAHAEYFFGREDLTDQLIEKLKTRNFVAVIGASGSGKSSLVRAGLIHQLRQGHKFSGSDRWRIQLITPTDQPLRSLASAFVNSKAPTVDRAEHLRRAEALLREGGTGLSHLVRASLISSKYGRNSRLLLIIDQFEEVFTLCQGPQAERDRHRFFNSLLAAMQKSSDCLSIVIVLRADFFGKCSLYNGLAEQIEQNLVTVTPLTYEQIKASVVKPAQRAGLVCDPNLVYNILLDVVGAPGELPLLQYTLLELWKQRQPDSNGGFPHLTLNAYTELGGVRGTLQKRANEIFYSLNLEEQRVARRIFIALTQLGEGTEDTRRRILKSELVSPRFPAELVDQVLEKLVTAKLVVTSQVASTNRHQERINQGLANVSTALRLAQMRHGKSPKSPNENLQTNPFGALQTTSPEKDRSIVTELTQLPVNQLTDSTTSQAIGVPYQETVDVAHETLIRNWSLLRCWLDENREMLRRQRRFEHGAREWYNVQEIRSSEYLLQGDRLADAEDYLIAHPDELSALAQRFIAVSREESRRTQKELRLLQMVVPGTLLVALMVTFVQYRTAVKNQAEKDYQLRIATSRQQAAIAQSILQEPDGDPTTALLISRLAAEQGGRTYEAQASLRAALQKLQLQANLLGHRGTVHQIVFSPTQQQFATAGEDGTIRIWSLKTRSIDKVLWWRGRQTSDTIQDSASTSIISIAFSPDGKQLAAIAKNSTQVQVWSVESGAVQFQLNNYGQATKLAFSSVGKWIAAASTDNTVRVWNVTNGQLQTTLSHSTTVQSLELSPDGQQLLTASGNTVQLWQISSGRSLKKLHHASPVNSATFSPNGQLIATVCEDGSLRLLRVNTGQVLYTFAQPAKTLRTNASSKLDKFKLSSQSLVQALFSPDGQLLATVEHNQRVSIWSVVSGQLQTRLDNSNDSSRNEDQSPIAFSSDSQRLVTTNQDSSREQTYSARLWNVQTGHLIEELRGHSGRVEAVQSSLDGSLVATASEDGSIQLWAARMGSEFPPLKIASRQTQRIAIQNSSFMKESQPSNTAFVAAHNRSLINSQPVLNTSVSDNTTFFSSFDELVAVGLDDKLQNWIAPQQTGASQSPTTLSSKSVAALKAPSSSLLRDTLDCLRRLSESIESLKLKIQGQGLVPTPIDPNAVTRSSPLVETTSLTTINPTLAPKAATTQTKSFLASTGLEGVAFSGDGQLVATINSEGRIAIWQSQSNKTLSQLRWLEDPTVSKGTSDKPINKAEFTNIKPIRQFTFSSDSQKLLGIGSNRIIYVWNVSSGKLISSLQGHSATVERANFSLDGQKIVSASRDHTARIWQISTGKVLNTISHQNVVSNAQFSPDAQLIATASWDGTARVLDATTGAFRVILAGHQGAVLDAGFSPDGEQLVTASIDGTARIWNAQTGTEEAILRPVEVSNTPEPVRQAFFSSDGRYVATLSQSGQIYLWAATWEGLLELARDRSVRQLKPEECLRYLRLPPNSCPILSEGKG